jgi:hypothetical protein
MHERDAHKALRRAPIISYLDAPTALAVKGPKLLLLVHAGSLVLIKTKLQHGEVLISRDFPVNWKTESTEEALGYLEGATSAADAKTRATGAYPVAMMIEGGSSKDSMQLISDETPEYVLDDLVSTIESSVSCQDHIVKVLCDAKHHIVCKTPVFQGIPFIPPGLTQFDPFNL